LLWERWYLALRDEFTGLYMNCTNETALEKALMLHKTAGEYYTRGKKYYPDAPVWYAIYMRKAYLLEKQAVEIVRRCT
jgi:hypothetical protein